jgi:hypothetical protein
VIFDQFEEFFTTNPDRWQERKPFFDQLRQALEDLPTLKLVFVMREEYIAQLEPFEELLPEKMRTRMHLERLRGNAARSAVVKPFQTRGLSFDPTAADELMAEFSEIRVAEGDKFREARGEFVEPVQLQVVCQSLWENLPDEWKNVTLASTDTSRLITLEYVDRFGDVNEALGRYYDRSVEKAVVSSQGRIVEGELRRWFGTALITPTGTRGLAFRGAPGASWRIPGLTLKELEDAHVIRREERTGTITHELTHDRFIEPIQKSNEAWLARYRDAERIRAKLEESADRGSDELLDELSLREAEEYLNSPTAKILGATPEARQLVTRSRRQLEEAKRRQAEELEEARQRAQDEEQLRKAESERVRLLLEKRKRERIFGVTVFAFGIMLISFATFGYVANRRARQLSEKAAADLKERARENAETGQRFRDNANRDLVDKIEANPIKDVTALRNLVIALRYNPNDTKAAALAANLLIGHIWCPPAAPEVRYREDALLATTFAPGGSNNEIFAVAGDGQLLLWKEGELSPVRSLFEKPKPTEQNVVQPGFASFSPDGQWLFIIPPTLASAANAEAAVQGGPPQGGPPARASSRSERCTIQTWRRSMQNRTYEPAGADLEIQRLPGSRINFAWSNESDRLVIINARGANEAECAVFEVEENGVKPLPKQSEQLNRMKIVALAFAAYRIPSEQSLQISDDVEVLPGGIAAVSLDSASPAAQRKVTFLRGDDLEVIPKTLNGQDSILLSEGFQANGIAFGPGNDELTLTSWSGLRILKLRDGKVTPIRPPTFRDQFMRMVVGPGDFATRLVATSLYGRVEVAKSAQMQESAEPVVFRGSIGIPQFSSDGQRLLILSGGMWNVFDSMRLIDVSPMYRPQEAAPENFEGKPVPPWLADIASAVSAFDPSGDGTFMTLQTVRERYPESKAGDAYESVWKRFFPEEKSNGRLETGR